MLSDVVEQCVRLDRAGFNALGWKAGQVLILGSGRCLAPASVAPALPVAKTSTLGRHDALRDLGQS